MFDLDERYAALWAAGDPLERLGAVVEFDLFRGELDAALDPSDRDQRRPASIRSGADVPDTGAADASTLSDEVTEY